MRILQIVPQTRIGGAESFGFNLSVELARRGHRVLLLANRANGPLLSGAMPSGMEARALDRTSRLDPRILSFLIGALARFRPDVIHAHNYESYTWGRFLGLLAPKTLVVCHVHSSRFVVRHSRQRIWTDRLLFPRATAVIALNEIQARFLRERLWVGERKLHVIPNGIATERFRPPADAVRSPSGVVCVASLIDVKNHAGLLRAWRAVAAKHPEATLTLVGDGPLRRDLEEQARADGIAGSVRFAGALADVRPALWASSVFVLPSDSEAQPISLLEAMAAGLACVATGVGSVPEILEGGRTGWIVPKGDPGALARALNEVLAHSEGTARVAEAAQAEVRRRFDLAACVDRIEAIYSEGRARRGASRSPAAGPRAS